jgi:radical SAM superfamily enzyme YgiQ (UPF0313 family)
LIREGEVNQSLAIASILALLKSDTRITDKMVFHHLSINSFKFGNQASSEIFYEYLKTYNFSKIDFIAISAYIWNEFLTNNLISYIRKIGFNGKIILGGYQITYAEQKLLKNYYPNADIFISGYAEKSLQTLFLGNNNQTFLNEGIDFSQMPSPYLTNELAISVGTKMIRLETKRGCPYRCTFCAHRDLNFNKVYKHPLEKVFTEIDYIKNKEIKRVNILDPIFNVGKDYLDIMKEINQVKSKATFTLQTRFENIKGEEGVKFLELCADGNFHLEFGLQTINEQESEIVNRKNDREKIENSINLLKEYNISYEVSLIYGLPSQTLDSFRKSIDFVSNKGCKTIKAYPLMLLRGTELYEQKEKWDLKENNIGEFNIPTVTSSNSFTKDEWLVMNDLANKLNETERI